MMTNSSTRVVGTKIIDSVPKRTSASGSRPWPRISRRPRVISVDLDGTVANIRRRYEYALQHGPDKSNEFYNVFLDGEFYHLDEPIPASLEFLWRYVRELKGRVVYLSGRRQGTEGQTEAWLRQHGFPNGEIIHREMGMRSLHFKSEWLITLRRQYWVDAHIGDRLEDDGGAARFTGTRFIHIRDNNWPQFEEILKRFNSHPNQLG
jgi:predicted secreted acid phosphatase